jgi:hypothetical protein
MDLNETIKFLKKEYYDGVALLVSRFEDVEYYYIFANRIEAEKGYLRIKDYIKFSDFYYRFEIVNLF